MANIWTMGEMLVEIMRPRPEMPFHKTGEFIGPFPSGAPVIFADTVARLGHSAGIIGGVGKDGFGQKILQRLKHDGVNCDSVLVSPKSSTAVAFVTYFKDGSRQYIFHINGTSAVKIKVLEKKIIPRADFFHIMGCSLMVNSNFRKIIIKTARVFLEKGAQVTFDPNIRVELLKDKNVEEIVKPVMEYCSILFPGVVELKLLTGEDSIESAIQKLFQNNIMKLIILKRGKMGCSVFSRDERIDIPAFIIKEVDPTGAGDCFDAGFLCGLSEGKSIYECGRIASAVGALNAAKFGPMEGKINSTFVKEMLD